MAKTLCTWVLVLILSPSFGGQAPSADSFDWQRARDLRSKFLRGESLDVEELRHLRESKTRLEDRRTASEALRMAGVGIAGGTDGSIRIKSVDIPEALCPIRRLQSPTADGDTAEASMRLPPGLGPFPAILFIHGGFFHEPEETRREVLLRDPLITRFLAAGYVVVRSTFRDYQTNVQSEGPILDTLAIVEAVKKLKEVHAASIVVFGSSGGGSIAFDVGSRTELSAIVAAEPATVIFTGVLKGGLQPGESPPPMYQYRPLVDALAYPYRFYSKVDKARTRGKLEKLNCPVLILHGDIHPLRFINKEIFLPELRAAGVYYEFKAYPDMGHSFYAAPPQVAEEAINETLAFCRRYVPAVPAPI